MDTRHIAFSGERRCLLSGGGASAIKGRKWGKKREQERMNKVFPIWVVDVALFVWPFMSFLSCNNLTKLFDRVS